MRRIPLFLSCAVLAVCTPVSAQNEESATELSRILAHPDRLADFLDASYGLQDAQVRELEARLESLPGDQIARGSLLAYYRVRHNEESYARHALWLIEQVPASPLLQSVLSPALDPRWPGAATEYHQRVAEHWREQAARNWSDPVILRHAGNYLRAWSPWDAERIGFRLRELTGTAPELLAGLYVGAVQGSAVSARGLPTLAGYDPKFGEHAVEVLERSNDTELLGTVVDYMAPRFPIPEQHREEILSFLNLDLAARLLARAESLDPENPRWQELWRRLDLVRQPPG